ncbi:hypothetical protein [Methylobacterium nigriterrae]|uniref:hypothetical protein n=1 Tax=Methylobacterium nigriterrae TaxID=3127512 RepID=UPI003013551B
MKDQALNGADSRLAEWPVQAAEDAQQFMQTSIELASQNARTTLDQLGRTFVLSDEDAELILL